MEPRYDHHLQEQKIYDLWEKSGAFNPDTTAKNGRGKPFTIIMPPPNANDPLHIGHAMGVAVEDVFVRFHRMLGDDTLWLPGTDHAGIETQYVFEKKLHKNGQSRFQFDRQTLYQMIWEYVQENSNVAIDQMKKLGASADWSRFTFMLDKKVVAIALDTFSKLHQLDMVYRALRLVNYCTKCGTAYSELEVKHVERLDPLYFMQYGPFVIATTRPETKFRDTALAVNPTDPRYTDWLGKKIEIIGLLGPTPVTVIADDKVDPAFGTGIMKVTPAHDYHDFELGKRYNLPITQIIDFSGRMDFTWFFEQNGNPLSTPEENKKYLERAKLYHGKKIAEVRKIMAEHLKEDGLLVKIDESYSHSIGTCYKCGTVIEPLPLPQFFIKVKPLVEPVLDALDKGEVTVVGAGHDKILRHWLENLQDWNISRQIVWGIRIPVWYSTSENPELQLSCITSSQEVITGSVSELLKRHTLKEINAGLQSLKAPVTARYVVSVTAPGPEYLQETDTFDTWFSSSQWPFSTLQSRPNDFDRFYPTSVMETGYDILPFWVMRMLMMGIFSTGKLPFAKVYLHGLVRDQKGQKMSKSKGNVVNPLEIVEKFGADSLRLALVIRSTPGLDKSIGDAEFKAARNFTNKVWNAARFVLLQSEKDVVAPTANRQKIAENDQAAKERLDAIVAEVTRLFADLKPGVAVDRLYDEFWHWFCDDQIEAYKIGSLSLSALQQLLITFIKLLHPCLPFLTEVVWQELLVRKLVESPMLITADWPAHDRTKK